MNRTRVPVYSAQAERDAAPLYYVSAAEAQKMREEGEAKGIIRGRALRLLALERLRRLPAAQILTVHDILAGTARGREWQRVGLASLRHAQ